MRKTQENNTNGDCNEKRVVKYKLLEMEMIRTGITKERTRRSYRYEIQLIMLQNARENRFQRW